MICAFFMTHISRSPSGHGHTERIAPRWCRLAPHTRASACTRACRLHGCAARAPHGNDESSTLEHLASGPLSRHLCPAREFLSLLADSPRVARRALALRRAAAESRVLDRRTLSTVRCEYVKVRDRVRANVGRGRVMISRLFTRVLSLSNGIISVIRALLCYYRLSFSLSLALRSGVGKFAWPRGYVFVSNDLCRQMGRARVKVSCWALSMTAIDGTLECASRKNAASGGIRI